MHHLKSFSLYESSSDPIKDPSILLDIPELKSVFKLLNFKNPYVQKDAGGYKYLGYQLLTKYSALSKSIGTDKSSDQMGFDFQLMAVPSDYYRFSPTEVKVGGSLSKKQFYQARFVTDLIKSLREPLDWKPVYPIDLVAADMLEAAWTPEVISRRITEPEAVVNLPEPLRTQVMKIQGYSEDQIEALISTKEIGIF